MPRDTPCTHPNGRWPLNDAYGIFCAYVCDACEDEVRSRYRPEIFSGAYEADEPIEDD